MKKFFLILTSICIVFCNVVSMNMTFARDTLPMYMIDSNSDSLVHLIDSEGELVYSEKFDNANLWNLNEKNAFINDSEKQFVRFRSTKKNIPVIAINEGSFENYDIITRVSFNELDLFGIYFDYADEDNNYLFKIYGRDKVIRLLKKNSNGQYDNLKSGSYYFKTGVEYQLKITCVNGNVKIYINDDMVISETVNQIARNKIGFYCLNSDVNILSFDVYKHKEAKLEAGNQKIEIYVSPDGSDSNNGSKEYPLQTIDAAKEKAEIPILSGNPVDIIFEEGTYFVNETISFTANDSGTPNAPVTYRAEEGKNVVFTGGKIIDKKYISPITNAEISNRVTDSALKHGVQIDLSKLEIDDAMWHIDGNLTAEQNDGAAIPVGIYLNDSKQSVSKWPNEGFNLIESVESTGGTLLSVWNGSAVFNDIKDVGGIFKYSEEKPSKWGELKEAFLVGYTGNDYFGQYAKIKSVDSAKQTIQLDGYTNYGLVEGHRWSVYNVPEEMDLPGEYYIDPYDEILYLYPEKDITDEDELMVMGMNAPIVSINGASYIDFSGITFEKTRGIGLNVENSSNININRCTIKHIGSSAVYISKCSDVTVDSCIIKDNDYSPVTIRKCGDLKTLTDANILICNNLIYNSSQEARNSTIQDDASSCGISYIRNTYSGSKCMPLISMSVDSYIGYNEMYNHIREAYDSGVIYQGRDLHMYDGKIEYNYVHDYGYVGDYASSYPANGIFMDDLQSGITIQHNIIVPNNTNNTAAIKIGGGTDNDVRFNTIANASNAVILEHRISDTIDNAIFGYNAWTDLTGQLEKEQIDVYSSQWQSKHPRLSAFIDKVNEQKKYVPDGNVLVDNIRSNCTQEDSLSSVQKKYSKSIEQSIDVTQYNDVFVDPEKQDYRVTTEAKEKYNLPDVLDESFDIDQIGSDIVVQTGTPFAMNYPENGAEDISIHDCWISWQKADYADEYFYEVASDKDFSNIVDSGRAVENRAKVNNLENGKDYYWRVSAKRLARRDMAHWQSISGVFTFKTIDVEPVKLTNLRNAILDLENTTEKINEGDEVGQQPEGTKRDAEELIQKSQALLAATNVKQEDIDAARNAIFEFTESLQKSMNTGYIGIDFSDKNTWRIQGNTPITASDPNMNISFENGQLDVRKAENSNESKILYENKIYPTSAALCFDLCIDNYADTWCGITIKQTNTDFIGYAVKRTSAYMLVIKKDVLELQRYNQTQQMGGIVATAANDVLDEGKYHSVQFGAIPTDDGIQVILNVDGKNIINYIDSEYPYYDNGYFTVVPMGEMQIHLKPSQNIPEGKVELPEVDTSTLEFLVNDDSICQKGEQWNKQLGGGYNNLDYYYTTSQESIPWSLVTKGYDTKYKLYFYNVKGNTDANVKVDISTLRNEEHLAIDTTGLPQGEWCYLADLDVATATIGVGGADIVFTPSGSGKFAMSALKLEKISE